MRVINFGHATFQLTSVGGVRLLTDPWLYEPIYGNMAWQFPATPFTLDEYLDQDVVYVSHDHPDHWCPSTIAHFRRDIPIVIRRYVSSVAVAPKLRDLGFQQIVEVEDLETVSFGDLQLTVLADPGSTDSALVATDGVHTVFDQNDCMLALDRYDWIAEHFDVDLSLQHYSNTSLYPAGFIMSPEDRRKAASERNDRKLAASVDVANRLRTRYMIPAANDMALLLRPDLDDCGAALPIETAHYFAEHGATCEVLLLSPGDVFDFESEPVTSHFPSRAAYEEALTAERAKPYVADAAARLDTWERRFGFDPDRFVALIERFGAICDPINDDSLRVLITVGESDWRRAVTFDGTCHVGVVEEGQGPEPDLELFIEAELIGAAAIGAYTFEDLLNCRWRIRRDGPQRPIESQFWAFLSAFSDWLEQEGEQPAIAERGALLRRREPGGRRGPTRDRS